MAGDAHLPQQTDKHTGSHLAPPPVAEGREQGVIVGFIGYNHGTLDPLIELQLRLTAVIEAAGVGEMDGNVIEDNDGNNESGMLFMYGPDADPLYETVRPTLRDPAFQDFMRGAEVLLEYGPTGTGAHTRLIQLDD